MKSRNEWPDDVVDKTMAHTLMRIHTMGLEALKRRAGAIYKAHGGKCLLKLECFREAVASLADPAHDGLTDVIQSYLSELHRSVDNPDRPQLQAETNL